MGAPCTSPHRTRGHPEIRGWLRGQVPTDQDVRQPGQA